MCEGVLSVRMCERVNVPAFAEATSRRQVNV